jgi:lipoprotein signal peptidase
VTDFIDPMRYPSFNLADSWIVIGVAAMILLSIFERDDEPVAAAVGPDARTTHREPEATR